MPNSFTEFTNSRKEEEKKMERERNPQEKSTGMSGRMNEWMNESGGVRGVLLRSIPFDKSQDRQTQMR